MRLTIGFGLTAALGLAAAASADVSYVSQERSIYAYADHQQQTASATDFSVFNASVSDSAEFPWGGSSAFARQNSVLGSSAITADGLASASGSPSRSGASAWVRLDVTFDLLSVSDVQFSGVLNGIPEDVMGGATVITLERVGGPVLARFDGTQMEIGEPWQVDFSGANAFRDQLEAGRYRVTTQIYAGAANFGSMTTNFNWTLSGIPTPGSLAVLGFAALAGARRRRA